MFCVFEKQDIICYISAEFGRYDNAMRFGFRFSTSSWVPTTLCLGIWRWKIIIHTKQDRDFSISAEIWIVRVQVIIRPRVCLFSSMNMSKVLFFQSKTMQLEFLDAAAEHYCCSIRSKTSRLKVSGIKILIMIFRFNRTSVGCMFWTGIILTDARPRAFAIRAYICRTVCAFFVILFPSTRTTDVLSTTTEMRIASSFWACLLMRFKRAIF